MNISEAYDSRVAYPLIVVAALSLLFVDISGHKVLPLKSSSNTVNAKAEVSKQPSESVTSEPTLPTLSNNVKTEDLSPGESPLDIQTSSPQASTSTGSGGSASSNSGAELQNTPVSSPSSSQPSITDTENLVNGLTNEVIQVPKNITSGVTTLLNHQ